MTRTKHRKKKRNLAGEAARLLKILGGRINNRHEIEEMKELVEFLRKLYA
jgi:hypothetical protein